MGKRIIRALDRLLNVIIIAVCAIFLFVSVYSLVDNYWLYKNANDTSLMAYKPAQDVTPSEVEFISEKQAAWLQIYDTPIDYPVMQGADNYEYLNQDPYGEFKLSGAIFLDYRNDRDLADSYSVVYGHHMEYGNMFGSLDAFIDRDYFEAHRRGRLVTRDVSYDLELFAVAAGEGTDSRVFDPTGRTTEDIKAYLNENAMFDLGYTQGERIVALTTCWGETASSRLLVFGVIRPQ